jgi:serine carboxypeptidase-like clade 2
MRISEYEIDIEPLCQIGNAILEYAEEQAELYEFLWQRAFISDSAHDTIRQHCQSADDPSAVCQAAKDTAYGNTGDITAFNIYAATCHDKKVRATSSKCTVRSTLRFCYCL